MFHSLIIVREFDLMQGISAGIDMSLHVVSRLYGREVAVQTARDMEYEWSD